MWYSKFVGKNMFGYKNKTNKEASGFTLIELLVVIAIIALLSSVALIAFQTARAKSRNVKRLSDATQMNTALELYFAANKGYPSATGGVPVGLSPSYANTIPVAPQPADGACDLPHSAACVASDPNCNNVPANTYYYIPLGTSFNGGNGMVYPSYTFYFCLGDVTGNFSPGERILTPSGVR
jgi:prepilin-type N-terminal cleavage/methylation domain-containing protein